MSSDTDEHSDDAEHIAAAQALTAGREKKRRSDKHRPRHDRPLKLGLPSSAPPRLKSSNSSQDEEHLLQQCQAVYSKLPKHSRYAQHKLKCLSKAMELLQRGRAARTQEEAEELQRLLNILNLYGTASSKEAAATHGSSAAHAMECEVEQAREA